MWLCQRHIADAPEDRDADTVTAVEMSSSSQAMASKVQDESIIFLLGFKLFPLLFQVFSCFSFAIPLFFSRPTHIQHVLEFKFVRMKSKKWRRPCQRPHLKELRRDCVFSPGRGEEVSVVSLRCREVGCEGKSSA